MTKLIKYDIFVYKLKLFYFIMQKIKIFAAIFGMMMVAMSCSSNKAEENIATAENDTVIVIKTITRIYLSPQTRGRVQAYFKFDDGTSLRIKKGNGYVLCAVGDKMIFKDGKAIPYFISQRQGTKLDNAIVIDRCWNGNDRKLVYAKEGQDFVLYRFDKAASVEDILLAQPGDTIFYQNAKNNNGAIFAEAVRVGFKN